MLLSYNKFNKDKKMKKYFLVSVVILSIFFNNMINAMASSDACKDRPLNKSLKLIIKNIMIDGPMENFLEYMSVLKDLKSYIEIESLIVDCNKNISGLNALRSYNPLDWQFYQELFLINKKYEQVMKDRSKTHSVHIVFDTMGKAKPSPKGCFKIYHYLNAYVEEELSKNSKNSSQIINAYELIKKLSDVFSPDELIIFIYSIKDMADNFVFDKSPIGFIQAINAKLEKLSSILKILNNELSECKKPD